LIASPFAVAAALNVLSLAAGRWHLHSQQIPRYGFLFAVPWAWLLDQGWPTIRQPRLEALLGYIVILWIPAALYSIFLWLVFAVVTRASRHRAAGRH
jgi:hypothetical protein